MGCGRDHTGSLMGADELHFLPAGGTAIGFQPCGPGRTGESGARPENPWSARCPLRPRGKSLQRVKSYNIQQGKCLITTPRFCTTWGKKNERERRLIGLR